MEGSVDPVDPRRAGLQFVGSLEHAVDVLTVRRRWRGWTLSGALSNVSRANDGIEGQHTGVFGLPILILELDHDLSASKSLL